MSDSGWCDEFVPSSMCGCEAGVRRVAPDEARKGKMIRVGIFFRPLLHSRDQGRKGRFKIFLDLFSGCSYGCRNQVSLVLFRLSQDLLSGLPRGCLYRLVHIVKGHYVEPSSLLTCLLILLVVVVLGGPDSGAGYTSILWRVVQGLPFTLFNA